jgi:hypothetical protein
MIDTVSPQILHTNNTAKKLRSRRIITLVYRLLRNVGMNPADFADWALLYLGDVGVVHQLTSVQ